MTTKYKLTAEFEGTQFFYTSEEEGVEYQHKNDKGEFHRLDGPAFVTEDGCEYWYKDGKLHREDGPASIYKNSSIQTIMFWYKDGKIHREDGPAYIVVSLNKEYVCGIGYEWYIEGERHREDGPACEYVNGDKKWFIKGKLHREDGPAVEKRNKKKWYKHGHLHREDGPAYEFNDGGIKIYKWYKDGVLHREDGHAYEFDDTEEQKMNALEFPQGYRKPTKKYEWWINGKRHRENEPAIIDGKDLFWYKNDLLHRDENLPAVITKSRVEWFFNGKRHREYGLPAVCNHKYGRYEWWINGSLHREDGPAVIEGVKQKFYLEHRQYPKNQFIELIKQRNEEVKNALLENTNICKDLCGLIANYVWFFDL